MTKHVVFPQIQYIDKVIAVVPVVIQRQIPQSQTVLKTGKAPLAQFTGSVVDVPVISQINQVTKHAVFPQIQYIGKVIAAVPVVIQRQVPHIQTSWKFVKVPPAKSVGVVVDVPVVMHIMHINQVTKHVQIPQSHVDKVVDLPVVMQRQVPLFQTVLKTGEAPSINQVTKHVEFPQTQYVDKMVDLPVVMARQVPQFQTLLKTGNIPQVQFIGRELVTKLVEIPQTHYIDKVGVDMPVVMQRKVPQIQFMLKTGEVPSINQVTKHVKLPQTRNVDKVIDVPLVTQRLVPHIQIVLKTGEAPSINQVTKHVEFPQTQYACKVVAVPLVIQRLVPQIQMVLKTEKVPQVQFICRAMGACGDVATGPSASNCCENSGSTADAVRRQSCGPGITMRSLEADVACLLRRLGTR